MPCVAGTLDQHVIKVEAGENACRRENQRMRAGAKILRVGAASLLAQVNSHAETGGVARRGRHSRQGFEV
jgi:hypothetical protein